MLSNPCELADEQETDQRSCDAQPQQLYERRFSLDFYDYAYPVPLQAMGRGYVYQDRSTGTDVSSTVAPIRT